MSEKVKFLVEVDSIILSSITPKEFEKMMNEAFTGKFTVTEYKPDDKSCKGCEFSEFTDSFSRCQRCVRSPRRKDHFKQLIARAEGK